jgi:hypothetical protein
MTEDQKEAFDAVQRINQELYEKYKLLSEKDKSKDWLSFIPILSVLFADSMIFISISLVSTDSLNLPEINLYSSINDDRIYYEKSNSYETFYKFIKRKFKLIKEEIYSIKL